MSKRFTVTLCVWWVAYPSLSFITNFQFKVISNITLARCIIGMFRCAVFRIQTKSVVSLKMYPLAGILGGETILRER